MAMKSRQLRRVENNHEPSRQSRLHQKKIPYFGIAGATLFVLGVGYLGYGFHAVVDASASTQHVMRQSKTIKEVYGQGAQGKAESKARADFDKLYNKYMKKDGSTVKDSAARINLSDVDRMKKLSDKTGVYYVDSYRDKTKIITLISGIQNDYVNLWAKGKVNQVVAEKTSPSMIYDFNASHYNELQTLLSIDGDIQYPTEIISKMQLLGADAADVERLLHKFSIYFTFPTSSSAWQVTHAYDTTVQSSLQQDYDNLMFKWKGLYFLPDLLTASSATGHKNEVKRQEVADANAMIASIKAASEASLRAKSESERIASSIAQSEKDASEQSSRDEVSRSESAKSSSEQAERDASSIAASQSARESSLAEEESRLASEASERSRESASKPSASSSSSESSSSSSIVETMPNYIGRDVSLAKAWANQHGLTIKLVPTTDGTYLKNQIVSQTQSGKVVTITYFDN